MESRKVSVGGGKTRDKLTEYDQNIIYTCMRLSKIKLDMFQDETVCYWYSTEAAIDLDKDHISPLIPDTMSHNSLLPI